MSLMICFGSTRMVLCCGGVALGHGVVVVFYARPGAHRKAGPTPDMPTTKNFEEDEDL